MQRKQAFSQSAENRTIFLRMFGEGCHGHQSSYFYMGKLCHFRYFFFQLFYVKSGFTVLFSNIYFDKNLCDTVFFCKFLINYLGKRNRIHRMKEDYLSGKILYLVFLQCTNHMKMGRTVFHQTILLHKFILIANFLHLIFSEILYS